MRAPGQGRKPLPSALKDANGNPGKRDLNNDQPKYELTNADAPAHLPELAVEAWNFYTPRLINTKILTDVDLHNLEAFCMAYHRWRIAEQNVAEHGIVIKSGGRLVNVNEDDEEPEYELVGATTVKNPAVTVINESLRQMATFGSILGLDPSSRQRLVAPNGGSDNPFKNL